MAKKLSEHLQRLSVAGLGALLAICAQHAIAGNWSTALLTIATVLGTEAFKPWFVKLQQEADRGDDPTVEEIAKGLETALAENAHALDGLLQLAEEIPLLRAEASQHDQQQKTRDQVTHDKLDATIELIGLIREELRKREPIQARAAPVLPTPVPDFVGREEDLKRLEKHLSGDGSAALISGIHGMGGIGKTQLAYKLGQRLRDRFPDAQVLIECQIASTAKTPETLLGEAIHAMEPVVALPQSLSDLQAMYRAALHGRRGLLLLDNAADRDQVAPLIPPPEGWAAVVTSRRRFAFPGACGVDLEALTREEAVALLRRILADCGRLATDGELEEIAKRCGDLPLAVRLAGSYLVTYKDWTVADYLKALSSARLKYLKVENESVKASIAVSVDQLERDDPALAVRWRLLALFPAPFDRKAAGAVWGNSEAEAVHRALSAMSARSLLDYDVAARAYSTHGLLREYARDPLPAGWDEAALRHGQYYLGLASEADARFQAGGEGVLEGLRQFDLALPHLEAAWERIERRTGAAALRWLCDLPYKTTFVLDLRMSSGRKIPWLDRARASAVRLRDRRAEGVHVGNLGLVYSDLGNPGKAIEYHEQSLAIARVIGDRWGEGNQLGNLALAYDAFGNSGKAIEYHEQALAIAREIGDRRGEGNRLGGLANAYVAQGDSGGAIGHYEQALAIAREIGDRRMEGRALGGLGNAYFALGDADEAIEHYSHALTIAREIGDRRGEDAHLGNMGNAYADLGDAVRAIDCYEQQLAIARAIGDRRVEAYGSWNLGSQYLEQGDSARAAELMQVCADYEREIGHPDAEQDAALVERVRREGAKASTDDSDREGQSRAGAGDPA